MNKELKNSIKYIKEKVGNKPSFSVPENYFNGIEDDFSIKLKEEQLSKKNAFDIPDNYFDNLESNILHEVTATIKPKKNKVIYFKERLFKLIPATVAASLILFLSIQFFKTPQEKPLTFEDVSLAEIEIWFDETTSYTDNTELATAYDTNIYENELTAINIKNDAIENYFNTVEDPSDLLNEIQ